MKLSIYLRATLIVVLITSLVLAYDVASPTVFDNTDIRLVDTSLKTPTIGLTYETGIGTGEGTDEQPIEYNSFQIYYNQKSILVEENEYLFIYEEPTGSSKGVVDWDCGRSFKKDCDDLLDKPQQCIIDIKATNFNEQVKQCQDRHKQYNQCQKTLTACKKDFTRFLDKYEKMLRDK